MTFRSKKIFRLKKEIVKTDCVFCKKKTEPDFRKIEVLNHYISDRGKIVGRGRTGICQKHQNRLAREIKRARHLALLSFITKA